MGLISKTAGFPEEAWQNALDACVPKKAMEINKKAFALGREA
jgi:indolepyruvate ferredoxin oxidoreductase beta subunit